MGKLILAALGLGVGWLIVTGNYNPENILEYSRKNYDPETSPKREYYVGLYYFGTGQHEKAVKAFHQMLTQYPTHYHAPDALLKVGRAASNIRRFPEAREAYEIHLEHFPDASNRSVVEKKYEAVKFKGDDRRSDVLRSVYDPMRRIEY